MLIGNPNNLYILRVYDKTGQSLIKFGYSNNINDRIKSYLYHNPYTEVIGQFYREDAYELERKIHKMIPAALYNEWYYESQLNTLLEYLKD